MKLRHQQVSPLPTTNQKLHMKRLFPSFLLILAAIGGQYTATANDSKRSTGDSTLQGYIIDQDTKKPVGDVAISLCNKQGGTCKDLKSDASGFFAFSQVPPGEFVLAVEKDGYKSYRKGFLVPKEGLTFKLNLLEDDEEGSDTWNPFRFLLDR